MSEQHEGIKLNFPIEGLFFTGEWVWNFKFAGALKPHSEYIYVVGAWVSAGVEDQSGKQILVPCLGLYECSCYSLPNALVNTIDDVLLNKKHGQPPDIRDLQVAYQQPLNNLEVSPMEINRSWAEMLEVYKFYRDSVYEDITTNNLEKNKRAAQAILKRSPWLFLADESLMEIVCQLFPNIKKSKNLEDTIIAAFEVIGNGRGERRINIEAQKKETKWLFSYPIEVLRRKKRSNYSLANIATFMRTKKLTPKRLEQERQQILKRRKESYQGTLLIPFYEDRIEGEPKLEIAEKFINQWLQSERTKRRFLAMAQGIAENYVLRF